MQRSGQEAAPGEGTWAQQDSARIVCFLAVEGDDITGTGQTINVDGGIYV